MLRQPAAQIAEADDVIAVIRHLRWGWQVQRTRLRQQQKTIFGRRGDKRRLSVAPVGDQLVERPRLEHRAGQDVGANLGALFHDANRKLTLACYGQLFQTDRRRETGWSGPDDHDVVLHLLALYPLLAHAFPWSFPPQI